MMLVPSQLKTVAVCHPLTCMCCTVAKSVLSFVFVFFFFFALICKHPEDILILPCAALQLGSSATCLSVEVPVK